MDQRPGGRQGAVAHERIERPGDDGWNVAPLLVRRSSRLRSPVVEDRPIELLSPDPDRPSLELPPLRELLLLLGWAILPASLFLVVGGWQLAVIAATVAVLLRELNRRAGRAKLLFADGFLRFRGDDARAQGIQEEDDVRWAWSGRALTGEREDDARPSWPGKVSP